MLFSGAAEMVGVRFDHKRNPITIRATTAPIIAHFGIVDFEGASFAADPEIAAVVFGVPAACLNFSGASELPSSSV